MIRHKSLEVGGDPVAGSRGLVVFLLRDRSWNGPRTGHRRCYEGWQPRRGRRGAPSSLPQDEHNQPPCADSNSSIERSIDSLKREQGTGARGLVAFLLAD